MSTHVFRARRWVLALAASLSPLIAGAVVWLYAPTFFQSLRTFELAAVVGLLVLPLVTTAAVLADRRRVGG